MIKELGKCSCPHVYVSGGKRYVAFSKGGMIYRLDLESGAKKKLCFGDEYLPTGSGSFLLRTGQTYAHTEEIT